MHYNIIIPPDEVIIGNPIQLPIHYPPPPPHPVGPRPPIIIVPIPDPPPVTLPPVVIITQPEPVKPVKQDRRKIRVGHGPADQKPAAPAVDHRESHIGRNPIVSNPPSQTYTEDYQAVITAAKIRIDL